LGLAHAGAAFVNGAFSHCESLAMGTTGSTGKKQAQNYLKLLKEKTDELNNA